MAVPPDRGIFLNISCAFSEEILGFLHRLKDPVLASGLPEPSNIAGWSKLQELVERHMLPQSDLLVERFAPAIAGFSLGGVPVFDIRPRNWREKTKVAIYTHGGFALCSAASTLGRAALFANDTALRVISVDYTLTPFATFEEISNQVVTVVRTVLHEGYRLEDTVMFGDSSGGGLAMAVILKLRDLRIGLPAAAVLFSPDVHLIPAYEGDCAPDTWLALCVEEKFMIDGTAPTGRKDAWPMCIAPIYADFSRGFSPTLIQGSTQEVLSNDFLRLYHFLDRAGVRVLLDLHEGTPHGFLFTDPDASESKTARHKMCGFVRLHLAHTENISEERQGHTKKP